MHNPVLGVRSGQNHMCVCQKIVKRSILFLIVASNGIERIISRILSQYIYYNSAKLAFHVKNRTRPGGLPCFNSVFHIDLKFRDSHDWRKIEINIQSS